MKPAAYLLRFYASYVVFPAPPTNGQTDGVFVVPITALKN